MFHPVGLRGKRSMTHRRQLTRGLRDSPAAKAGHYPPDRHAGIDYQVIVRNPPAGIARERVISASVGYFAEFTDARPDTSDAK